MKMRRIVVPEEHQDRELLKLADAWHRFTVRVSCDRFDSAHQQATHLRERGSSNRTYSGVAFKLPRSVADLGQPRAGRTNGVGRVDGLGNFRFPERPRAVFGPVAVPSHAI